MFLQSIRSWDKKILIHGHITWRNGDEFGFIPNGKVSEEFWCKQDFWEIIENNVPIGRIKVI